MQFVASGDWESYACVEKDKGDQLYAEGRRKRAIDIYCRVLFLQINGATDTSQMKSLGETVAPFGAHGFVTGQVYERMVECCKEATMTDDDIKARFIEAVAKTHNKAMPMDPAQAWEAIKANRAELAECDRIKREARNKARRDATALAKAKSKQA